jgi:hypothetical protein
LAGFGGVAATCAVFGGGTAATGGFAATCRRELHPEPAITKATIKTIKTEYLEIPMSLCHLRVECCVVSKSYYLVF